MTIDRAVTAETIRDALTCAWPGCACRRGRTTHCPAHDDRRPSLGVDERDGKVLLLCRSGCRQNEVIDALRARGLWSSTAPAPRRPARRRSILDQAREEVLAEARRQRERYAPYRPLFQLAEVIRHRHQLVHRARRVATTLGVGERAWNILAQAARLETEALAAEAVGDELVAALHEARRAGSIG